MLSVFFAGALGDAWGAPYEGQVGPLHFEIPPRLALTDDTQLTLATCEAIVEAGRVDAASIADHFRRWYQADRIRRMGSSTLKAMRDLAAGTHWALAGARGEYSAGAGAAMRIAPLAFLLDPNVEYDRQMIRDVCRITHHNDEAYAGALAVVYALRGMEPHLPDTALRDRIQEIAGRQMSPVQVAQEFGASGHVVNVVPLALLCASQPLAFDAMLAATIELGGDTDTIASIAGQVAGRNTDALLMDQIDKIEGSAELKGIVRRFAAFVEACGV